MYMQHRMRVMIATFNSSLNEGTLKEWLLNTHSL